MVEIGDGNRTLLWIVDCYGKQSNLVSDTKLMRDKNTWEESLKKENKKRRRNQEERGKEAKGKLGKEKRGDKEDERETTNNCSIFLIHRY